MSVHGVVTVPAAEWERLRANEFAATQMAETILHQARELARLRACEAVLRKIVKHELTSHEMPVDLFEESYNLVVIKC